MRDVAARHARRSHPPPHPAASRPLDPALRNKPPLPVAAAAPGGASGDRDAPAPLPLAGRSSDRSLSPKRDRRFSMRSGCCVEERGGVSARNPLHRHHALSLALPPSLSHAYLGPQVIVLEVAVPGRDGEPRARRDEPLHALRKRLRGLPRRPRLGLQEPDVAHDRPGAHQGGQVGGEGLALGVPKRVDEHAVVPDGDRADDRPQVERAPFEHHAVPVVDARALRKDEERRLPRRRDVRTHALGDERAVAHLGPVEPEAPQAVED